MNGQIHMYFTRSDERANVITTLRVSGPVVYIVIIMWYWFSRFHTGLRSYKER